MPNYTDNLGLIQPLGSEKIRIAQINQNMDTIDEAVGAVGDRSLQQQILDIGGGIAIMANNNTHPAITAGQFVFVRNHSTLADGAYTANSNIAENATLSSSNLTAVSGGGFNALKAGITSISDRIKDSSDGAINLNNYTTTGMYAFNGGTSTNAPAGGASTLIVQRYSNDWISQMVTIITSNGSEVYVRDYHDGTTWSSWEKLALNNQIEIKTHEEENVTTNAYGSITTTLNKSANALYATFGADYPCVLLKPVSSTAKWIVYVLDVSQTNVFPRANATGKLTIWYTDQ